jgi:uncharacterized membrane protein
MQLFFERPALLWGLWLALLPWLIHLLQRHRARRQPFAAMDFLLRVQQKSARRLRLKQLALLVLRAGLIAALALAAAGPRWGKGRPSGGVLRLNALVLDASFSMRARVGEQSFFELARRRALELVASATEDSRWCLLLAGARTETLLSPCSSSPAELSRRLSGLRPGVAGSNLIESARLADRLLSEQPRAEGAERRVWLLTDGAAHAFAGEAVPPDQAAVVVEMAAPADARDNLALLAVDADAGEGSGLRVTVRNFGRERSGVRLQIGQEGKVLSTGFLDLPPAGTAIKYFAPESATDGLLEARLEEADALEEDNRRQVLWRADAGLGVLLIDGDPRPTPLQDEVYFLEQALRPGSRGARYQISVLSPEKLSALALTKIRVVVLANVRALDPAQTALLEDFVRRGGGLLIAGGDQLEVEASTESLRPLLAVGMRDVVELDRGGRGLFLSRLDQQHPAFSAFSSEEIQALHKVPFRRALALESPNATEVRLLAEFENGLAALVESSLGAGRVVLYASSLDLDWNDWPARATYLPFFRRLVDYLGGRLQERSLPRVEAGRAVKIPQPGAGRPQAIIDPQGRKQPATLISERGVDYLLVAGTDGLGLWQFLEEDGSRRPAFFVDPPAAESDLQPVNKERIEQLFGNRAELSSAGTNPVEGRHLDLLFLLLAGLLVALESFLIRR